MLTNSSLSIQSHYYCVVYVATMRYFPFGPCWPQLLKVDSISDFKYEKQEIDYKGVDLVKTTTFVQKISSIRRILREYFYFVVIHY